MLQPYACFAYKLLGKLAWSTFFHKAVGQIIQTSVEDFKSPKRSAQKKPAALWGGGGGQN